MTPTLLPLECRDFPAVWYGGEVWLSGVGAVRPFEDWHGDLSVFHDGDGRIYVGGGAGAGPRVAVLDATTGGRVRPDYWAGDPGSRGGATFVPVGLPVAPGVGDPGNDRRVIAHGPAGAFPVFVDFEAATDQAEVMAGLHRLVPSVRVTNRRPDGVPREYGTAVLTDSRLADYPLAGTAYADWTRDPPQVGVSESVYVDAAYTRTPLDAARMLAHEIAHGFRLIPDEV